MNESQENGHFHNLNDNKLESMKPIQFDINKLLIIIGKTLKKTLDNKSCNKILINLLKNSDNKILSQLNKFETYLYSIQSINNKKQLKFLFNLGIAFNLLFLQIQNDLNQSCNNHKNNNNNNQRHCHLYPRANINNIHLLHPPHPNYNNNHNNNNNQYYHSHPHGFMYGHGHNHDNNNNNNHIDITQQTTYNEQRRNNDLTHYHDEQEKLQQDRYNNNNDDNISTFDIEVSLCDCILVCCIEIYLIILENCKHDDEQIFTDTIALLEKLLIIGSEIRQPYDWLTCNISQLKQKWKKLKYFVSKHDININNRKNTDNQKEKQQQKNKNKDNNRNQQNDDNKDGTDKDVDNDENEATEIVIINKNKMDIDDDDVEDKEDQDNKDRNKHIKDERNNYKNDNDKNKNKNKEENDIDIDIPSFCDIKLKKAIKLNDIDGDGNYLLTESTMNRISQISRLDNRNLFNYIIDTRNNNKNNNNNDINDNQSQQTNALKQNDRIKLINEWIFDVFNQSNGIQRLLSVCLKRMELINKASSQNIDCDIIQKEKQNEIKNDKQKEQKKENKIKSIKENLMSYNGRKYILLHLENIHDILDVLFCIISLNGNNKKIFNDEYGMIEINIFIPYLVSIFNKLSKFHEIFNESIIELIGKFSNEFAMNKKENKQERYKKESQEIEIRYLMEISTHFEQTVDTICKLLHLPFLTQQTILRRYIAIQCKIAFNRQIMYLFANKLFNKHSNISLNKQYLSLFAGDPKLVEPLLTNLAKNKDKKNKNNIYLLNEQNESNKKSLSPQEITTNREVICAFIATNFYLISKIHSPIVDLIGMPHIQISSKKHNLNTRNCPFELFSVDTPIIDKYSGMNLDHNLYIIDQEPLPMNQIKSQHQLLKL